MFDLVCFIGLGFIPCVILIILTILQWSRIDSPSHYSLAYSYAFKIMGLICLFTKQVLYQPIVLLLFSPIWYNNKLVFGNTIEIGYDYLSSVHIVLIAMSCLTIFLLTLFLAANILLFSDEQPDSKLPWASSSVLYEIYQIIWKLCITFMVHLVNGNTVVGIIAALFSIILCGLGIYENIKQAIINDINVFYPILVCEISVMWFSLAVLLDLLLNVNLGHPILFALIIILAIPITIFSTQRNHNQILSKTLISLCSNSLDVEICCKVFLSKLSKKDDNDDYYIDGAISYHCTSCSVSSCPCHSLVKSIKAEELEEESNPAEKQGEMSDIDIKFAKPEKNLKLEEKSKVMMYSDNDLEHNHIKSAYIRFLIWEVEQWVGKHEDKARLHLYLGSLKLFTYPSPLAALYEVLIAQEEQTDIYEQFHIHRML